MSNKLKSFLILTLVFGSVFLLIPPTLAVDTGISTVENSSLKLGDTSPVKIATNIINILMGILGLLAVCLVLYGGVIYMTSGGSEEKISRAKSILKNGAIGLVIILSAWGIAFYVLKTLVDVTGGSNGGADGCSNVTTSFCGCGGAQTCNNGTWGSCLGSTCNPIIDNKTSCDGKAAVAGCQADSNLCGSDYTCDDSTCLCKPKAGLGDSCNANPSGACKADDSLCGPYLKCDPNSCVCVGPPVITGISPAGGFCVNDSERGCVKDDDCLGGSKCDTSTPNGAANNFITIYGYNFGKTLGDVENSLTNVNFDKGSVGSVPDDWTVNSQKRSSVGLVADVFKSGKQSVRIHQDANLSYPGNCKKETCQDISTCTWNDVNKTCTFSGPDQSHPVSPAVYSEGQVLIGSNAYNVMSAKLIYDLAPLNFQVGETYSIQFYYKGKTAANVSVQVSPSLNLSSQCVAYDNPSALKTGYLWDGSKINPTPASGVDPCGFGKTCSEQSNACCLNAPYQKKCYGALNLTPISASDVSDWTLYSYTFQYTPDMENWLNNAGKKMIEFGLAVAYSSTGAGTDLYIDDFSVTKILNKGKVTFLGANSSQSQLANFPKVLNPNCISYWTDRQITISVPSGAANGPIEIKRGDNFADNVDNTNNGNGPKISDFIKNNIIRPGICQISPTQGTLGAKVAYQGINLKNSVAYFGEYSNSYKGINSVFSIDNLSGQTLAPSIVAGETTTFVEKTSVGVNQKSNALVFIKEQEPEAGPYISSFYPKTGSAGQYLTILGGGFGNLRGSRQVLFGDKEASYDFPDVCSNFTWSDNQVIVKVPNGLNPGDYEIKINLGNSVINTDLLSPNNKFKFDPAQKLKTSICKIDPIRGQVGEKVTLWGENFGASDTDALVVFNRGISTSSKIYKDGTADKIETAVPVSAMGISAITGPVHVLKNGEWGNEVNFTVGKCVSNTECGASSPVCCPANTFKTGACAASLLSCYFDVPNSVYETKFDTILSGGGNDDEFDSCIAMASFYGGCQTGQFCPNSPGKCSPFNPIVPEVLNDCGDTSSECGALTYCKENSSSCTYNSSKDVCQTKKCQLEKELPYTLEGVNYKGSLSCRAYNDKVSGKTFLVTQLKVNTSCPAAWISVGGGYCVNEVPVPCDLCPTDFSCQEDANLADTFGICQSSKICASDASCGFINNKYSCLKTQNKSCDCCCEIGQDTRDCCAPLKCAGTCGSDTIADDGKGYGSCSGCSAVGTTQADHDAACNCSTTSGKFCDTSKTGGVCTDCAALSETECGNHTNQCCFDSAKGVCQGGNGTLLPGGKCAYYDCGVKDTLTGILDKTKCNQTATTTGQFLATSTCGTTCPKTSKTVCDLIGNDSAKCSLQNNCCFDDKTDTCLNGTDKFNLGGTNFCAYYNCDTSKKVCNETASTTGSFLGLANCNEKCGNDDNLPGASCASATPGVCNTSFCGSPYNCLPSLADEPVADDCGICCCIPGKQTPKADNDQEFLTCVADKGSCTGIKRGLFCGCLADSECGASSQGCGDDTCCDSRPSVTNTSPKNDDTNVCRNRQIEISFNKEMDVTSLSSNILLLEEKSYGTDTCPNGSVLSFNNFKVEKQNIFVSLYNKVVIALKRIWSGSSSSALAISPSSSKLYCVLPITIETTNEASSTKAYVQPQNLLAAKTNYFVVIKGDENLDSNSGIMSLKKIGLNGPTPSSYSSFNGVSFNHSYTFGFTTMDDNTEKNGLCAVNRVAVSPSSVLIKTSENNASDDDPSKSEFDKINDNDRALLALAYSLDNQLLQPVSGYAWSWNWQIDDSSVVNKNNISGIKANQIVISSVSGVTDRNTKVKAVVDMSGFSNASLVGNGLSGSSDVYVFLCANPWPMELGGVWSPWFDRCTDILGNPISGCTNYNYKFYYCRDAGEPGTADDLPAVANPALILGSSGSLVCSTDGSACSSAGAACGTGGTCVWNVLKESYFFREAIPQTGEVTEVKSTGAGGSVIVDWYAPINTSITLASFKIYYGLAGGKSSSYMASVSVNDSKYCSKLSDKYVCSLVVDKLEDGKSYYFKVSSVTDKKAESPLFGGKEVTPTDTTSPAKPINLTSKNVGNEIVISWKANTDDALYYRLFHGLFAGKKAAESVDSENKATSLTLKKSDYRAGDHYFFLAAVDQSGNVSITSDEIKVNILAE